MANSSDSYRDPLKNNKYKHMKLILLGVVFLYNLSICYSQQMRDTIPDKSNPILYTEFVAGYAGGNAEGFTIGTTFNYQKKTDLFTFRYLHQT